MTVQIFKALTDIQRIRILNLLNEGPLCVCHFMSILSADQVPISKQLRYLKSLGIVESKQLAQWRIYELCSNYRSLVEHLFQGLRTHADTANQLAKDLKQRQKVLAKLDESSPVCCIIPSES